ncbi:MAG: universal stress protein [Solirubrobacteraceae bacterium]
MKSPKKVLVLYEQSRAGAAAIDLARELAVQDSPELTVVAIAPRAPSGPRCGNSALEYNEAVAESVAHDLEQAKERLCEPGAAASAAFVLLVEGTDQTLEQFARSGGFDLVLLPAHRRPLRRGAYHPEAARLTLSAGAEIRIVGPASRAQPQPQSRRRRPGVAAD